MRRARALLSANLEVLDHLAVLALERETLTREDLDDIFEAHELTTPPGGHPELAELGAKAEEVPAHLAGERGKAWPEPRRGPQNKT